MSTGNAGGKTKEEMQTVQGGPSTWSNPAGRVSVQFAPGAVSSSAYLLHLTLECQVLTAREIQAGHCISGHILMHYILLHNVAEQSHYLAERGLIQ